MGADASPLVPSSTEPTRARLVPTQPRALKFSTPSWICLTSPSQRLRLMPCQTRQQMPELSLVCTLYNSRTRRTLASRTPSSARLWMILPLQELTLDLTPNFPEVTTAQTKALILGADNSADHTTTYEDFQPCSSKGDCDGATGTCTCNSGHYGEACEKQSTYY